MYLVLTPRSALQTIIKTLKSIFTLTLFFDSKIRRRVEKDKRSDEEKEIHNHTMRSSGKG